MTVWCRILRVFAFVTTWGFGTCAPSKPRELPMLCDGCLSEPLEIDYFGGQTMEPPRVRFTSIADFEQAARSGKVLLIENATFGTAFKDWSCERLATEFSDAKMRREYDWNRNPEDEDRQTMGDTSWITRKEAGADSQERLSMDEKAPPNAPFYWAVREGKSNGNVTKRIKRLIAQSVPSFMNPIENSKTMYENTEFWLGAKGTGARAHMDSHCISTLSFVLSGERRWRLGPVPRMPKGAGKSNREDVIFDDGVAYALGWKPMFEFTAKQGDAILFPPGWIHESLNIDEGCTVALTTQFTDPAPARYFRSYYQRLRRIGDLNPCWPQMVKWAAHGKFKTWHKLDPSSLTATASTFYDELFPQGPGGPASRPLSRAELDFHDLNEDDQISKEEFLETILAWHATENAIRGEKPKQPFPKPDMSLDVPVVRAEL